MRQFAAVAVRIFNFADQSVARFRRSEDGSMIVLFLFFIMVMMPLVGITVILNRVELLRVQMQNTMDRAVLAAADIDQTLPPSDVVMDYLTKAGLDGFVDPDDIQVTPEDSVLAARIGRSVSVCGRGVIRSNITDLETGTRSDGGMWVNYARNFHDFAFTTCSGAEETKTDIEVILVLDVSGSMEGNNKLTNLQAAAKEFVDTVITDETSDGKISIGIVPYNGQVNAAPLLPYLTVSGGSPLLNCINFSAAQFGESAISTTTSLTRADYFDPWNRAQSPFPSSASRDAKMPYCPNISSREIVPPTNNRTVLKNHIDAFHAAGYTSLENGMKWGTALIDPAFRPVIAQLATAGTVPSQFSDRPFDFGVPRTAKFIVLMSDGQNTTEWRLGSGYRSGDSPIYRDASGKLSIYHDSRSGSNKYYQYDNGTWASAPYAGSTQLTWPEVWQDHSVYWVARYLYDDPLGWNNSQRNAFINDVAPGSTAGKDTHTSEICGAAKAEGVTVFTIGFEAPAAGNAALLDCATSPAHFFDVQGLEISEAFRTIARKISELRLTI